MKCLSLLIFAAFVLSRMYAKRYMFVQVDFEDFYHSETQIELLNWFVGNGYAINAGIIAGHFTGQDTSLYAALQACISLGSDKCGIFNHGEDSTFLFSNATSVADAKARISTAHKQILKLFPDYNLNVFLPNENAWNEYTLQALRELDYAAISGCSKPYSDLPWNLSSNPMQISQQTATGVLNRYNNSWTGYPVQSVISECIAAGDRGEDCVILIHPHEFSKGDYTFENLQQIIDGLTAVGFTESTTFNKVVQEVKGLPSDGGNDNDNGDNDEPNLNSNSATGSDNSFFNATTISVIVIAGVIFLVLAGLITKYAYQSYKANHPRNRESKGFLDVDSSSNDSSDDSIELGSQASEDKMVPGSIRRSNRSDDTSVRQPLQCPTEVNRPDSVARLESNDVASVVISESQIVNQV